MLEKKKKFKYKPLSLKDIISEMKQNIDLMIDLAYSAIKFRSKELADETYKIEQRNHELIFLLNIQVIQSRGEAKKLEPIIVLGASIDKISDALSDIAHVVYVNTDISQFTQIFWDIVPEPIVKITVKKGCGFIGQTRKDVHFRSKHGVDLIAIIRNNNWLIKKDEKMIENDILIIKGEIQPIRDVKKLCCDDEPFSFEIGDEKIDRFEELENPDIMEKIEELKRNYVLITDISETMIEIADQIRENAAYVNRNDIVYLIDLIL